MHATSDVTEPPPEPCERIRTLRTHAAAAFKPSPHGGSPGGAASRSDTCGDECERFRFRCILNWAADFDAASAPPALLLKSLEGSPTKVTAANSEQLADGRWSMRAVRCGVPLEYVAATWPEALALLTTRLLEEASAPAIDVRPTPLPPPESRVVPRRTSLRLSELHLP